MKASFLWQDENLHSFYRGYICTMGNFEYKRCKKYFGSLSAMYQLPVYQFWCGNIAKKNCQYFIFATFWFKNAYYDMRRAGVRYHNNNNIVPDIRQTYFWNRIFNFTTSPTDILENSDLNFRIGILLLIQTLK